MIVRDHIGDTVEHAAQSIGCSLAQIAKKMSFEEKRVNVFKYILVMTAACMVFAIMQGIHDNYGIMMNGLIGHTKIPYASAYRSYLCCR